MQGRKYAVKTALITVAVTVLMIQAADAVEVGNGQSWADFANAGKASTTVASESSATGSNLPEYILAVPSFSIPFSVDRQDTDSTEVRLYVSSPDLTAGNCTDQNRWSLRTEIYLRCRCRWYLPLRYSNSESIW